MSRYGLHRHLRERRGFALFLALLVLLVVTVSGIALLFNTQIESSLSSTETKISKAFYAADSGIAWAADQLRSNAQFPGGPMPAPAGQAAAMSANIPGRSADVKVTVTPPIVVGWTRHPGDEISASGGTYQSGDIVESLYHVTSTSSSTELQSTKSITCDIGIYPSQLQIAPH